LFLVLELAVHIIVGIQTGSKANLGLGHAYISASAEQTVPLVFGIIQQLRFCFGISELAFDTAVKLPFLGWVGWAARKTC